MTKSDDTTLTVILGDQIADAIDYSLSPMDGIIAIKQLIQGLPDAHRKCRSRRRFRRFSTALPIYRGLIDWCGVGFDYVEYRGCLHVLGIRNDVDTDSADAVILQPTNPEQYFHEADCGDGVSIIG